MKERIKKLRKSLGLTQQEFADRIGISRGNIATYETRDGSPGSSAINLICREFGVNETWLRTGAGEMFVEISVDDELEQVFSEIAASDDELIKRIIRAYWQLDDREKATVKKLIDSLAAPTDPAEPERPDLDYRGQKIDMAAIDAQVEEYRRQLLLEQEQALQTSSANGSAERLA